MRFFSSSFFFIVKMDLMYVEIGRVGKMKAVLILHWLG